MSNTPNQSFAAMDVPNHVSDLSIKQLPERHTRGLPEPN